MELEHNLETYEKFQWNPRRLNKRRIARCERRALQAGFHRPRSRRRALERLARLKRVMPAQEQHMQKETVNGTDSKQCRR